MTKKSIAFLIGALVLVVSLIGGYLALSPTKEEKIAKEIAWYNNQITDLRNERDIEYTKDNEKINPMIEQVNKLTEGRDATREFYDKKITELKNKKAVLESQQPAPLN